MKQSRIFILFALVVALTLGSVAFPQDASAYSKNNQISDEVFYNYKSMSQSDIQRFIDRYPKSCLNPKNYPSNLPPITFKQPLDYWSYGTKNVSPAYIIHWAANNYKLNPQVILTTLEKENQFVSGTSQYGCPVWAYNSAMGYDCTESNSQADYPDRKIKNTCVGHEGNAGFVSQVSHGSWQLSFDGKRANGDLSWNGDYDTPYNGLMTKGWRARVKGGPVTYFDGYAVINGKSVYLENGPTAALYNYTPHFTSFDTIFTRWFGDPTFGYTFKFENLAGKSGALNTVNSRDLGSSSKTLIIGDKIFVFYYDASHGSLRYSYWNGSKWKDYLLDGTTAARAHGATTHNVGQDVTAITWNGDIQVYYYDATSGDLRHAWFRNNVWRSETMDGSRGSLSHSNSNTGKVPSVLLYKGNIQLYYYDVTHKSLRHAWWPGDGRWHFETMDGTKGSLAGSTNSVGSAVSSLIYEGDQIQLYYYDATSKSLKHTWWPGDGRWHFETMDGTKGSLAGHTDDMGSAVSATLYNGHIQMYYYDRDDGSLKHAWWPGDGRWHFETMDGEPTQTSSSTLLGNYINAGSKVVAKQFGKDLVVFYYDNASDPYWSSGLGSDHNSAWRVAYFRNGSWYQSIIDGGDATSQSGSSAAVSGQLSFGLYQGNSLQVFYRGSDGSLKHAWYKN